MAYLHLSKGGEGRARRASAPSVVIQERLVEVPVLQEVIKEVVVERPVEVIRYVTNTVDREVTVEVPVEIERIREVIVEKPVEVIKEVIKEVFVTKTEIVKEEVHVKTFAYKTPKWAYVAMVVLTLTNILSIVLR